ncbi:hypothetical protein Q4555_07235 [Octadecabacter sp. 1_MG-2023]|uniref:hypothetical protein n=1 Tax=unclassified Octadecabacter TaxID=196158 RepID=UPI001C096EA6|nr:MULTISPECIES: hypothetical protein [unclassified Octadecabacter]MBU2994254.1 hypothetical protein [Octadecabacter sp. B2R22]MDO6734457.1 hypothetical protein [Octadecabacter sp. 1_MG-2023]
MFKLSTSLAAAAFFLSACQPVPNTPDTVDAAVPAAMSMADQVAAAACSNSVPERDDWLRNVRPSVSDVAAGYSSRGVDPEQSGIFKAYRAYMASGQDHAAAAVAFGDDYPTHAACFS